MDWQTYFAAAEQKLTSSLAEIRAELSHATSKGDRVEQDVRALLTRHLPRRFDVGQGQAFDQSGATTRQLDVIISTDEQPIAYPPDTPGVYLMEAIMAAAEVKSRLTTAELDDAFRKAASFKALRVTPASGDTIWASTGGSSHSYHFAPPFFIFAPESAVAGATIHEILRALPQVEPAGADMPGGPLPMVDAVFTLDRGVFLNFGDGHGSLQFTDEKAGRTLAGWLWLPDGPALLHLFWWLNRVFPRRQSFASVATPYLQKALAGDHSAQSSADDWIVR